MSERSATDIADSVRELGLDPPVVTALRAQLPSVARRTIAAVTAEVPQYADGLSEEMGAGISAGVQMALAAFLRLAAAPHDQDPGAVLDAALDGAYRLGRMEARSGRTMDALLSAYRVGARVAWHEQAETAVAHGVPAASIAAFAALVFAYIDELSAASVAGHNAELGVTERARARHLAELGQGLLEGEPTDVLLARADRAEWHPPETLTAVLLPAARLHDVVSVLDQRTLVLTDDLAGGAIPDQTGVLLVPDAARTRKALLRLLQGRSAIAGPARPWTLVATSFHRAVRALEFVPARTGAPVDTDQHLLALVLRADPSALADLREQALAPLADLRPATAERLAATLRSWLLHRGRRSAVANDLVIHPQTVRYRMTQLRELYGDDLDDPEAVLRLTVALALDADRSSGERG
jgi:DNA-binding PucR family transcriptional regulator